MLFETFFLFQLRQPFGLLGLHAPVLLFPAVEVRLADLNGAADVGDGLAWDDHREEYEAVCDEVEADD